MREHLNPFDRYHFDLDRMGKQAAPTGSRRRPSSCDTYQVFSGGCG
jgi:hypothetical protein